MDPLRWIDDALQDLDDRHLVRHRQIRSGPQSPAAITLNGESLVNFASNDYLGLAAEDLLENVRGSLQPVGWGSGASPLIVGHGDLHAELEAALAQFEETSAALLFSSGYAANVGTITALVGPGDVIFSDTKNHASIIDGCRLSGAQIEVVPHTDVTALKNLLATAQHYRRRLIVTDSLFSMDGNLAPLADLATLAKEYDAMLMVDEAHATGVLGNTGRGACELLEVEDGVHVRVGTLSKAIGSAGGFVAGSEQLVKWLSNRARSYVFSTAFPQACAAAALRGLEIIEQQPQRRQQVLHQATWLQQQLSDQGWPVAAMESQILALPAGEPERALQWSAELRKAGLLVPAIRPPSVAEGESRLRISLCYGHQQAQLEALARELGRFAPLLK